MYQVIPKTTSAQGVIFVLENVLADVSDLEHTGDELSNTPSLLLPYVKPQLQQRKLLQELRKHHVKVAVVSKFDPRVQRAILLASRLSDLVDSMVFDEDRACPFILGSLSIQTPISSCSIVVQTHTDNELANATNALRVLQVSGPSDVNIELVTHLADTYLLTPTQSAFQFEQVA